VLSNETVSGDRLRRAWWWARSPAAQAVVLSAIGGAVWAAVTHRELAAQVGQAGIGVGIGLAGWAGWSLAEFVVLWAHRRDRIIPLGWAVRHELGYPDDLPAVRFIAWDHNFGEKGSEIRVMLPGHWIGTDEQRRRLVRAVREKGRFAEDDVSAHFILDGRFGYLRVTPREKRVISKLARASDPDVRELLEATISGKHLLALGAGSGAIRGDLDGHAPHVGISMRTGRGKSNQIKGIVAQEMHLGASAVFCDLKRRSHKWAKGIEGVTYCREVADIHTAIIAFYNEARERNMLADQLGDDQEPPWQRRLLVMEEQNTTIDALVDYWAEIRDASDPRVSPAVRAYRALGNMGRQVNIHIIAAFQKLTAHAAGGTVARDNFGMIIMSGFKPSAWKMLADELPMPNIAGKPRGRNWYVFDGRAPEGQSILWTDRDAREWASTGASSKVRAGGLNTVPRERRPARRAGRPALAIVNGGRQRRLYTLREASSDKGSGIVPETHQQLRGLRSGSSRDPEFPEPDEVQGQSKLYSAEILQRWSRNREEAG
jgi:hypothetical protein